MAGRDFLLEIGVEELPAAAAASALSQAGPVAREAFGVQRVKVEEEQVVVWVTPRRIAIFIEDLPEVQPSEEIAERGPAAAAAFDSEGNPTRAAEGFARAKGVEINELEVREHQGKEFVFAVHRREGQPVAGLIPDICRRILRSFSFPKTMRWDSSGLRFSRPVRWLVTKFGEQTIEYEAAGMAAGDVSRGHRFLSVGEVRIDSPASYRKAMASACVLVDQEERRRLIEEGLAARAQERGAAFSDPAGELEEVLYLVEYPSVQAGSFGEEHLRLPDRVLVTAMQSHQRYFPLVADDGSLVNGFLYVMNGDPEHAESITTGNERILAGRIEDAEFSFDKDLEEGIDSMASRLANVVYHQKLGTLADKTERLKALVESLARMVGLGSEELHAARAAAGLAKADLVSVMVQEFPDLEGYIGSVYAEMEGYPSDVCRAISEQYMPTAAGGALPETGPGAVLAICDKVDNIVGAFSVNELPTGSRDPYGLRRAAVGIAAIAEKFSFDFDLAPLLTAGHTLYIEQKADVDRRAALVADITEFILDRIQHRQVEQGMPVEVFEAARASGQETTNRLVALAESLDAFRADPAFEDLHTAFFRCSKIAAKAGKEDGALTVDPDLFQEPAEQRLNDEIDALGRKLEELLESGEYKAALVAAASIRPAVDDFFDEVMVMAEDQQLRDNRLALVRKAARTLLMVGDPMRAAAAPRD